MPDSAPLAGLPTTSLPALLQLLPSGVVYYTPVHDAASAVVDFHFAYLNAAAQRILGLPAQPAGTYLQQWLGAAASEAFAFQRDTFLSEEPAQCDALYSAAGIAVYLRIHAVRLEMGLLVTFADPADQPRTAVADDLRQSQTREQDARAEAETQRQRLHTVLMQMPASLALLRGPEHVFDLINPYYQQLFPGRALQGQPLRDAIPELAGQGFYELFNQVYRTGQPFYQEEMEAWADYAGTGSLQRRYYRTSFQPIRNGQGEITEVLTFSVDITTQVEARQQVEQFTQELEARVQERTRQLTEQQAMLRQILSHVPAYIATLSGPEHRYTFFNELYQSLSGNRSILGLSLAEVFPELASQGFVALLDQAYASGTPITGTDTYALLANPTTGQLEPLYVDFLYQPLFDEQQQVRGILAFVLDVSDKVRARQQVQDLNKKLTATNEELTLSNTRLLRTNADLDTFVYTASHDLKAPIANIEGILHALREILPLPVQQTPVIGHLLGLLDHTVGRFLTTISQLTDLSRLQQTYNEPAELLALAPIVAEVVEDLTPAITAAGAMVHFDVPEQLRVSFAPSSLRSIVYNLLSNAVKYRDPTRPAQIWLRARLQDDGVVLTVQDNGLGLTKAQQQRLFGVFQRLHTHVEGTGVGLYMIKRLIDNAGASIAVASVPEVGSTFTVTFPFS